MSPRHNQRCPPIYGISRTDLCLLLQNVVLVGFRRLDITKGPATNYPNPPSPDQTFYANDYQTPIILYEPGVPILFSIRVSPSFPPKLLISNSRETCFSCVDVLTDDGSEFF